jgi:hypothetical protein
MMPGDIQADLFCCGPAGASQIAAERLIRDVGLWPVRMGDIGQVGRAAAIGAL